MSQVLKIGSDMGFSKFDTKAFSQKSPRTGNVCSSPMSQISTAPCTPSHGLLPDPDLSPSRQLSAVSSLGESTGLIRKKSIPEEDDEEITHCIEMPLQSSLGIWAQQSVEGKAGPTDFMLDMLPLQSELGRWAELLAQAEHNVQLRELDLNVVSFGMPPLESELGLQMERLVKAEEWYKNKVQEKFIVESSCLQDETIGLAYRRSKCIADRELEVEGPPWGTTVVGVDHQDGWIKVEDLYLPMTLAGTRVLTPCSEASHRRAANAEPVLDGPALTEDGRVMDLDGGAPIFFGCDRTLATGHAHKIVMINALKHVRNARMALDASRAADDVDNEEICSIDAAGILHGEESLSWSPAFAATEAAMAAAARLKLFSQKRKSRKSGNGDGTVGVDPNGKAFLFLYLPDAKANNKKRRYKEQAVAAVTAPYPVMTVDVDGTIHD